MVLSVVQRRWSHRIHLLQRTEPPLAREDVMFLWQVVQMYSGPGLVSMSPACRRRRDMTAGLLSCPFGEKTLVLAHVDRTAQGVDAPGDAASLLCGGSDRLPPVGLRCGNLASVPCCQGPEGPATTKRLPR